MKLVSPMIDGASSIYERLYELKEEEKIKIVFRFICSVDVDQGEGNDTGKYLEGEIESLTNRTRGAYGSVLTHVKNSVIRIRLPDIEKWDVKIIEKAIDNPPKV